MDGHIRTRVGGGGLILYKIYSTILFFGAKSLHEMLVRGPKSLLLVNRKHQPAPQRCAFKCSAGDGLPRAKGHAFFSNIKKLAYIQHNF